MDERTTGSDFVLQLSHRHDVGALPEATQRTRFCVDGVDRVGQSFDHVHIKQTRFRKLDARLFDRDQVSREVAAVDGRYVLRQEWLEGPTSTGATPRAYYTALNGHGRLGAPTSELAARALVTREFGAYTTPAGHPRVSTHWPDVGTFSEPALTSRIARAQAEAIVLPRPRRRAP